MKNLSILLAAVIGLMLSSGAQADLFTYDVDYEGVAGLGCTDGAGTGCTTVISQMIQDNGPGTASYDTTTGLMEIYFDQHTDIVLFPGSGGDFTLGLILTDDGSDGDDNLLTTGAGIPYFTITDPLDNTCIDWGGTINACDSAAGNVDASITQGIDMTAGLIVIDHAATNSGVTAWQRYTLTQVPEPGTALLVGIGALGLAVSGRGKRQSPN